MLELFDSELGRVENLLTRAPQTALHEAIRTVPLEIFGELLLAVPEATLFGVDSWKKSIRLWTGFAFLPQRRPPAASGEITYGKTSLTLDHLAGLADGWRLTDVEWTPSDPLQVIVALEPT